MGFVGSCRDDRKAILLIAVRPRSGPRAVEAKILPRHCCSRNLIQNFFGYPSLVHLVETERLAQESSQTGQYSFHTVCSTVADERSRGICFCSRNRKKKNSVAEKNQVLWFLKKKKRREGKCIQCFGSIGGSKGGARRPRAVLRKPSFDVACIRDLSTGLCSYRRDDRRDM